MDNPVEKLKSKLFVNNMMESAIRIGLLFVLFTWTYDIIKPFIMPLLWGAIIAVALMPLTQKFEAVFNIRRGWAATIVVLLCIALLVTPFVLVSGSIFEFASYAVDVLKTGDVKVPGPSDKIGEIPLIGNKIYEVWSLFSTNLEKAITHFSPEIKIAASKLTSVLGSNLATLMMFIVSLAIAAGFMANTESISAATTKLTVRVVGKHGEEWTTLMAATIRSVLLGVVGVALIQSVLIGAALFIFEVPAAGLITLAVLILGIAQVPVLILMLPVIGYMFSTQDTTPATIFSIWVVLSGLSDNVLKPLLMGRGVDVPMPVILIGAIGGMISAGVIGLFLGAVILAIWYELFITWIKLGDDESLQKPENESETV